MVQSDKMVGTLAGVVTAGASLALRYHSQNSRKMGELQQQLERLQAAHRRSQRANAVAEAELHDKQAALDRALKAEKEFQRECEQLKKSQERDRRAEAEKARQAEGAVLARKEADDAKIAEWQQKHKEAESALACAKMERQQAIEEQHALRARVEALQSVASNAELGVAAAEAGAEERYCELYGELQSLKRVLSTSQALATELQEKVTQLELTLAAAQRRVSEVQQVADAAQQQNDASQRLREEIEQLRSASHHKDIELELVKEAAANDQAALAQGAKQAHALDASMLSLKAELAELKQKLELQQSQLEAIPDLKSQLSHLERQLEAERGAAHDKEAALAQEQLDFKTQRSQLQTSLAKQEQQVELLRANVKELETTAAAVQEAAAVDQAALAQAAKKAEAHEAGMSALRDELAVQKQKTHSQQSQLQEAAKDQAALAQAAMQIEAFEASTSSLTAEVAELKQESQHSQLQVASDLKSRLCDLERQLEAEKESVRGKESVLAQVKTDVVAVQQQHQQDKAAAEQAAKKMKAEHATGLAALRKDLKDALRASNKAAEGFDTDRGQLLASLAEQKRQVQALEAGIQRHEKSHAKALKSENCLLQKALRATSNQSQVPQLRQQVGCLQRDKAELQKKMQDMQTENHSLHQEQQEQSSLAASAKAEVADLKVKLQQSLASTDAIKQAEVASLQQQPAFAAQVAGLSPLPAHCLLNQGSGPLGFPNPSHVTELHPAHCQQPKTLLDPILQRILDSGAPPSQPQLSPPQAISRRDSLSSINNTASVGPHTPSASLLAPRPGPGNPAGRPRQPYRPPELQRYELAAEPPRRVKVPFATPDPQPGAPHGGERHQHQFASAHVKPLVGDVVRATDMGDDTHVLISAICRKQSWRFYADVRGDGNCGFRAIALALVVAVAQQPEGIRLQFAQHLDQLYTALETEQQLLQYRSKSGGFAQEGHTILKAALQREASQRDRYRMGGGLFGPSRSLIGTLNQQCQSDAVVQFMRALAASHMLANVATFELDFQGMFDGEERNWTLAQLCHAYVCPHCEGSQAPDAVKRGADAANVIKALSAALHVGIVVGTATYGVAYVAPGLQGSRAPWSDCQLHVAAKKDHFCAAWV
ncbi:hypothetical protein ABBQ32_002952 [Trebouxia sp. C0010 RCD-2024]